MAYGDNVCIPLMEPGSRPSGLCAGTVRGKRLVSIAGAVAGGLLVGTENVNIKECAGATEFPVAIAVYEGASGDLVPLISGPGMWVPLVTGAAVVAGQELMSDSQGRVIPYVGPTTVTATALPSFPVVVGVALDSQASTDADVPVRLNF